MAGIGFELKKLFNRRGLFASVRAYGYAGIVCTGPMLLGIVLLLGVLFLCSLTGGSEHSRELLVCMITYTLLSSLTVTSFLSMVVTRFIADQLYEENYETILPSFWGSSALMLIVGGILYGIFLAFSGAGLLPFGLEYAKKQGSARKPVILAFLTVCGIIFGMQLLLPAVFGGARLKNEICPVLPLLEGADLPGNVLARFDVIWMGFLVFGLLFSLGSLFHYGNQIAEKTGFGTGRYWIPAAGWLLSLYERNGMGIREYYGWYLGYIFVPFLLVIQLFLSTENRGRRKKKITVAGLVLVITLTGSGCAAVEPEKRAYPLALGAGVSENGFVLKYAMPDMSTATGQEKPDEDPISVLTLSGRDFQEIEAVYNRSQEKFLDLGHLEVLILDEQILEEGAREALIGYLKQEEHIGEDVYVFRTNMLGDVFHWKGARKSSIGEYLQGIQENRTSGQQKKGVTLREVYHQFCQDGTLPWLPEVWVEGELLEVDYGSNE